jgi:hypothetical protein
MDRTVTFIQNKRKYLVMCPRPGSTPRWTDWLTVSRKVTLTLESVCNEQFYESVFGSSSSQRRLIIQVHLYLLCDCNKYYRTIRQVVVFAYIYIYIYIYIYMATSHTSFRNLCNPIYVHLRWYVLAMFHFQVQINAWFIIINIGPLPSE